MSEKLHKTPTAKKRIFIVDDHPMLRDGLRLLFSNEPDLEVCGEAEDAAPALEEIEKTKPDLVLSDITLRTSNGLDLIKDLQTRSPIPVLVISMHDETLYAERVLKAGARGYVMKQEGGKRIVEAVRRVLEGETFVSAAVASRIVNAFAGRSGGDHSAVHSLSDREFEVFRHIGEGLTTKEIADRMHISTKTVEAHRVKIKQKMEIQSVAELMHTAVRWVETEKNR